MSTHNNHHRSKVKERECTGCRYENYSKDEYGPSPCYNCRRIADDKYEPPQADTEQTEKGEPKADTKGDCP